MTTMTPALAIDETTTLDPYLRWEVEFRIERDQEICLSCAAWAWARAM
jgi:hypothetical protein